jgi:nucleoside-diphosphate-sugar epimerase
VKRLMNGMPGCPQIYLGIVDVRDVADLHVRAMTDPAAKGERFIAVSGNAVSMLEMGAILRSRLGEAAKKVPTRQLPNWFVRVIALADPGLRTLLPMLGKIRHASSAKAQSKLGWQPRSREDALVATAESLIKFGVVKTN